MTSPANDDPAPATLHESERLWHVADPRDWQQAIDTGTYRCASLETEGFIHCCLDTQLGGVLQRYYAGIHDRIFLVLAPSALPVPVVMENTRGGQELFPHLYAAIPRAAIRQALLMSDPQVQTLLTSQR